MSITELNLGIRDINAISRSGCTTVEELRQKISDDPDGMKRQLGFATFDRIEEELLAVTQKKDSPTGSVLSIESPQLAGMRDDLDTMLQSTITSMLRRESCEASVTLKIGITLVNDKDEFEKTIVRPIVEHKITSAITVKSDTKGCCVKGDYELFFDEKSGCYSMRRLPSDDGQMSFFGEGTQ